MNKIIRNAKIVLENGISLEGFFFGFPKEVYGSFIFNVATTGYEELITDPSYNQEIVVMSFPVQGIYGISKKYMQSKKVQISAFVVQEFDDNYSHYESTISLNDILKENQVPGIAGIDTRYLVKIIREKGSIKGAIVPIEQDTKLVLEKIQNLVLKEHIKKVNPNPLANTQPTIKNQPTLIVYNFGCKQAIINELNATGFNVIIVPWNTSYSELKQYQYDGIFLSNGPGDPTELISVIKEIKLMLKDKQKVIGICLGNQLIALALGMKIFKLKYGHHSINHPVKNLFTSKVILTSQNHNYAVVKSSIIKNVDIWYESINDQSVEGLFSQKYQVCSVQFHPESQPGPLDSKYIFKDFYDFIQGVYEK